MEKEMLTKSLSEVRKSIYSSKRNKKEEIELEER